MAVNDNEKNDHDAAEGLAYLNRIALQELPINLEEEMQRIALTVHAINPSSHTLFLSKGSLSSASIG